MMGGEGQVEAAGVLGFGGADLQGRLRGKGIPCSSGLGEEGERVGTSAGEGEQATPSTRVAVVEGVGEVPGEHGPLGTRQLGGFDGDPSGSLLAEGAGLRQCPAFVEDFADGHAERRGRLDRPDG